MIDLRRYLVAVTIIAISALLLVAGAGTSAAINLGPAFSTYMCPPYSCTTVLYLKLNMSPGSVNVGPGPLEPANTVITLSITVTSGGKTVPGFLVAHIQVGTGNLICTNLVTNNDGVVSCPFKTGNAGHYYEWSALINEAGGLLPFPSQHLFFHT